MIIFLSIARNIECTDMMKAVAKIHILNCIRRIWWKEKKIQTNNQKEKMQKEEINNNKFSRGKSNNQQWLTRMNKY